jgi:hypothetical protein
MTHLTICSTKQMAGEDFKIPMGIERSGIAQKKLTDRIGGSIQQK